MPVKPPRLATRRRWSFGSRSDLILAFWSSHTLIASGAITGRRSGETGLVRLDDGETVDLRDDRPGALQGPGDSRESAHAAGHRRRPQSGAGVRGGGSGGALRSNGEGQLPATLIIIATRWSSLAATGDLPPITYPPKRCLQRIASPTRWSAPRMCLAQTPIDLISSIHQSMDISGTRKAIPGYLWINSAV